MSTDVKRAACGVRRRCASPRAVKSSDLSSHNAARHTRRAARCAVLLVLAACTPTTTRLPFAPVPEALHAIINAPPARVTEAARDWLAADTIVVRFASPRDAFLETVGFAGTMQVRLWADPDVPGKARVTVEAVYQPLEDPSRTQRDLEQAAPPGSKGAEVARRLMAALVERFGQTNY